MKIAQKFCNCASTLTLTEDRLSIEFDLLLDQRWFYIFRQLPYHFYLSAANNMNCKMLIYANHEKKTPDTILQIVYHFLHRQRNDHQQFENFDKAQHSRELYPIVCHRHPNSNNCWLCLLNKKFAWIKDCSRFFVPCQSYIVARGLPLWRHGHTAQCQYLSMQLPFCKGRHSKSLYNPVVMQIYIKSFWDFTSGPVI